MGDWRRRAWALLWLPAFILQGPITVSRNEAYPDFPNEIRFELEASSGSVIESTAVEFGTDALSCGQATARAYPEDFEPGTTVRAEWLWDLRRTGALPPGTQVWWRWVVRDSSGSELVTPVKSLRFDDARIRWQSMREHGIALYWHEGSQTFAHGLLQAGVQALADLERMTGVTLSAETRVYVYASSQEMQSATLFAPEWSGGLAFPRYHAVLLAVSPDSLDWGRRALAHELAHVVIGSFTFSCVDSTPPWVSEGLAMAAEGPLEAYLGDLLDRAVREDSLLPLRSLGSDFSGNTDLALLAYAQSRSLVDFLTLHCGQAAMLGLLERFREGLPEDQALRESFGVDRDGLETAWRAWLGAGLLPTAVSAGAEATRTPYPTFAPITGPAQPATATPSGEEPLHALDPAWLIAAAVAGVALVVVVGAGAGVLWWMRQRGRPGS